MQLLPTGVLPEGANWAYELKLDGYRALGLKVVGAGLEGVVAKRLDGLYEAGQRSGAWRKMRINRGQEFVIGGYTRGSNNFDAVICGYYEGDRLLYVARTRNGFTPALREQLVRR